MKILENLLIRSIRRALPFKNVIIGILEGNMVRNSRNPRKEKVMKIVRDKKS